MTVECHSSFTDPGVTASDACAATVQVTTTGSVQANTPGNYTLTYTATDPSGNTATAIRSVTVEDTIAPTVTLNGSAQINIEQGTPFIDPGATATDDCAGDLTVASSGTVDVNTPGTYPITYTAIDASENTGTVTRTVNVLAVAPPSITTPPQSTTAACGESVQLTVAATGLGQLTYQWKKGTENLVDGGIISGAATPTLTINPVSLADAADYSVVVANLYGNTPSAPATLTIVDAPPVVTLNVPAEVTMECHTTFNDPSVTTSDACSANVTVAVTGSLDPNAVGDYTLTYTATDSAGQSTSVTRTVHVVDTTPPAITLTGDAELTIECHSSYLDQDAAALDLCAGTVEVTTSGAVDVNTPGTYTITYTATDPSGNSATATRIVLVQDTTPPTVSCPADMNALADANCLAAVPNVLTGLIVSDNCDTEVTLVQNPPAGTLVSLGAHTITVTATDDSGNAATCTLSFTVTDRTPPMVALNGSSPMQVEFGSSFTDPGATAADDCAGPLPVTTTGLPVNVNSLGSYTITYTATDASENTASTTRTVNVVDTTAPVITLNGETTMIVECHGTFTDPGATAADACAGTRDVTTSGTVNANLPSTYTITYTATDPSGNSSSATRTVLVQDTTPPVLTLNGSAELTLECHAQFVDPGATAVDLCAGNLTVTVTGSVDTGAPGDYTLTYSASDPAGNAATPVTRLVHVIDSLPPAITLTGDVTITVECHTSFTDPGANATDNCAGNFAATASSNVDVNTPGAYTLTYTAADPSGNAALPVTRTVQVVDTTAPVVALNGSAAIQLELGTPYSEQGATAADNCAGTFAATASGTVDVNTPGSYTLTYTATDPANNIGTATRVVTVLDRQHSARNHCGCRG